MAFKKFIIIISSIFFFTKVFSQDSTDGKFIFKMWFYIEHVNQELRTVKNFPVKDSSLFSLYNNFLDLNFDTLKCEGFNKNYIFLAVVSYKNDSLVKENAIIYKKSGNLSYLSIPINYCEGYVLCINKKSGRSYRLKGFIGNDFWDFLADVKEQYFTDNNMVLANKIFFKNYKTDSLDYECIYQGLISGNQDKKNNSCLRSCRNFIVGIK